MTTRRARATLAEWASADARVPAVLERFGLDYCCRGDRTLHDACAEVSIDPAEVLAAVDDATNGSPDADGWTRLEPVELIEHLLSTHHAYLHAELPRLDALASKVATVHGRSHPELLDVAALTASLRQDLEPHLAKEERILFPMIRELAAADGPAALPGGSIRSPVSVMLAEHDATGELLARLRAASDGFRVPPDGCASYVALYAGLSALEVDTHLHVHKENHLLFPAAVALEEASRR